MLKSVRFMVIVCSVVLFTGIILSAATYDTILQIDKTLHYKQEYIAIRELRSQLCHYTKGILGGPELRNEINHAESTTALKEIFLKGLPL